MLEIQPILRAHAPFEGLPMANVPGVARMSAAAEAARYILRADGRTARTLAMAIAVPLPPSINHFETSTAGTVVMQLGPDEWQLLVVSGGADDIADKAEAAASGNGLVFALVDIGHRMASLDLTGAGVEDVLAAGCPLPLDLQRFPLGRATRTVFLKTEIVLRRLAADRFAIDCNRSFWPYLTHHLAETIAAEAAIARHGNR